MPTLQGEPVAQAIKRHQIEQSNRWRYRALTDELHRWVDRFDRDFDLGVPTPVIAIAALPVNVIATYRLGPSDIGARTTITFNERWLPHRPFVETLATLIHELLHAWEEWHCGRETGGWYHTVAWRRKLEEVGILADQRGHHLATSLHFTHYLRRYDVIDAEELVSDLPEPGSIAPPRKRRQLPKWVCGCPSGNPARAVTLHARCLLCGDVYQQEDVR